MALGKIAPVLGKMAPELNEQYFAVRLDPYKLHHSKGMEYRAICPLHGGGNPSQFWVNLAEGNWCCFSCGEKGGSAYSLEMKLLAAELNRLPLADEVTAKIEEITGTPFKRRIHPETPVQREGKGKFPWDRRQAQDKYVYTDEIGNELFTVWRFQFRNGSKITPVDRPCSCNSNPDAECPNKCEGGRIGNIDGVARVLFRLPDVMQSILCFIVEGEKNCKDLSRALAEYIRRRGHFPLGGLHVDRVAVTTNPGGAAGWKKEHGFGKHFYRKVVIKLGDNDGPGRLHDQAVCEDVSRYARELYTLELPVNEGEDISDFLERNTIEDFLQLLPQRKPYETKIPADKLIKDGLRPRVVLDEVENLEGSDRIDWLVEGLIERGSKGLIVAPPKTGKSLFFIEVAICLAANIGLLGRRSYGRRVKCAIISREDGSVVVKRRVQQLAAGHNLSLADLKRFLLVNTQQLTDRFHIDRDDDLQEMAEWLKCHGIEFAVIDVLNLLHTKQENSSDDMTRVMQRFNLLAEMSGAQICVIGHTNKDGGVKGSTAIEGWPDWIVRLEAWEGTEDTKLLHVRTKSTGAIPSRMVRYWKSDDDAVSRIMLVQPRQ